MLFVKAVNFNINYNMKLQRGFIPNSLSNDSFSLVMLDGNFFTGKSINNSNYAPGFTLQNIIPQMQGGTAYDIPVFYFMNGGYHSASNLHEIHAAINLGAICIPVYVPLNQVSIYF